MARNRDWPTDILTYELPRNSSRIDAISINDGAGR